MMIQERRQLLEQGLAVVERAMGSTAEVERGFIIVLGLCRDSV